MNVRLANVVVVFFIETATGLDIGRSSGNIKVSTRAWKIRIVGSLDFFRLGGAIEMGNSIRKLFNISLSGRTSLTKRCVDGLGLSSMLVG